MRLIKTGRNVGQQVIVTDGLSMGERVVVQGLQKIRPDMEVKVVQAAPKKAAAEPPQAAQPAPQTEKKAE